MDTANEKKIYEIVETQADELGDWGGELSKEQIEALAREYDRIQIEALSAAYPEIDFVTVNYGQQFVARGHNESLEEYDSIADFIEKHFVSWLEAANEKILNQ